MAPRRIPLDVERLASDYVTGASLAELARREEVSIRTVRRRLAEAGHEVPAAPPLGIHCQAEWLHRRYNVEAATVAAMAAEAGVDVSTIHRALQAVGAPRRGAAGRRNLDGIGKAALRQVLSEAPTFRAAAARLGVHEHTLRERAIRDDLLTTSTPPEVDINDLAAHYLAGATLAGLAGEVRVSVRTVRRWLVEAGVTMRPAGRPRSKV